MESNEFIEALKAINSGKIVCRDKWKESSKQSTRKVTKVGNEYIASDAYGKTYIWSPTHADLIAKDWNLVKEVEPVTSSEIG